MRKKLVLYLLIVPFYLLSDDEDFSYTYLGLSYNEGDSKGVTLEGAMKLPLSLYLSGSVERSDYQIEGTEFEKNTETVRIGLHFSIADIFKQVRYKTVGFDVARFLDFYLELGPKKWELVDSLNINKSGTDINFIGGVRLGDSEGWEANFFFDKSKQAEIARDPITNEAQYGIGEDTEDIFGFKAIRNYNKKIALVLEASDKSTSGSSYSLGFRYKL